ncbi:aminoglycoside phosphotransferase family protein [Phaeobacter sp. B1627]|uniref:aminoglycoside phosphotransferase family protein n=1 Tax=Phaeobacter sp. B1627 TaxID=2583809 RepID=UPI00210470CE|nr:aminoglycoside phosphotransferase family protein [Phaeobacter sp. B1627]
MTPDVAPELPPDLLHRFGLSAPVLRAKTPQAEIWQVERIAGGRAALKQYPGGDMGNEAAGVAYLQHCDGPPAVTILAASTDAVVMDWLEGPSLGDLARGGDCATGDLALAEVARLLLSRKVPGAGLLPLQQLFAPLPDCRFQSPEGIAAQAVARDCIRDLEVGRWPVVGLHGDLHHDNVIRTEAGMRAFDAKGIAGPAAYELANAFRHPRGCAAHTVDPEVISTRARAWSAALGCRPDELLRWAISKAALSMAWSVAWAGRERRQDLDLIAALLRAEGSAWF